MLDSGILMNFEGFLRCCGYWGSWVCFPLNWVQRTRFARVANWTCCAETCRNQRLGILPIGTLEQMSCQPTLGKPLVWWNGLIFTQKEVVEYLSLAMHFGEREQRNRNHNLRATSGHFYTFKQRKTGAKKVMGYPPPKKNGHPDNLPWLHHGRHISFWPSRKGSRDLNIGCRSTVAVNFRHGSSALRFASVPWSPWSLESMITCATGSSGTTPHNSPLKSFKTIGFPHYSSFLVFPCFSLKNNPSESWIPGRWGHLSGSWLPPALACVATAMPMWTACSAPVAARYPRTCRDGKCQGHPTPWSEKGFQNG